jgi:hypothetical protein
MKNIFKNILNYLKNFLGKTKEKELSKLIEERNRLNSIINKKEAAQKLIDSEANLKRALELINYDQTLNEDKSKFHSDELLKGRQHIVDCKITAPLFIEPDDIIHHNVNKITTNPTIVEIKSDDTKYVSKQLKGQAKLKNKLEHRLAEAKQGKPIKKTITTGE